MCASEFTVKKSQRRHIRPLNLQPPKLGNSNFGQKQHNIIW